MELHDPRAAHRDGGVFSSSRVSMGGTNTYRSTMLLLPTDVAAAAADAAGGGGGGGGGMSSSSSSSSSLASGLTGGRRGKRLVPQPSHAHSTDASRFFEMLHASDASIWPTLPQVYTSNHLTI